MISVRFVGRLGNQLTQHVMGCILSQVTRQIYLPPREFLADWEHNFPVKWSGPPLWTLEPQTPFLYRNVSSHPDGPQPIRAVHWIDINAIDLNRDIRLEWGYFQRYPLLRQWTRDIRTNWLRIRVPLPEADPETIYIHGRRGDYVVNNDGSPHDPARQCCATTMEEYGKCLEQFDPKAPIRICTDDVADQFWPEFGKRFHDRHCTLSPLAWDQDFLLLAAAKNLIISQSTFSWWAGFLGQADKIVCPLSPGSHWWRGRDLAGPPPAGEPDYPNLVIRHNPKWEWVE